MAGTNKALGQHWLTNRVILEEIAGLAAEGVSRRCCVEIGPGLGYLTSSLLKRFDKVVAVEYDMALAAKLPASFPGTGLEVVSGDILQFDFNEVGSPYVVAGNIPYYITSPIIEKVLLAPVLAERVVLLMQKEVAERILDKRESVLSLFVKNRAEVASGPVVVASEFAPPPKVDSQVVVFTPHAPKVGEEVMALIKRGFVMPRKKLINNLAGIKSKQKTEEIFRRLEIPVDARPAELTLNTWQKLYEMLF